MAKAAQEDSATVINGLEKEIKRLRAEVLEANKATISVDDGTDEDRLTRYTASMLGGVQRLPTNPEALQALTGVISDAAYALVEAQSTRNID